MILKQIWRSVTLYLLNMAAVLTLFSACVARARSDSKAVSDYKSKDDNRMKKQIYFAGGCFWGTEAYFSQLQGVIGTECRYANSKTEYPSYEDVCQRDTGHTETVLVEYDPAVITIEKLLSEFFKTIDPTAVNRQGNDIGSQYRSGIYYTDESDAVLIQSYVSHKAAEYSQPIATEVGPLENFRPVQAGRR